MYWGIAKELGVCARGQAIKQTECVQKEIRSLYGQPETGFVPSNMRKKRKRQGGAEGGGEAENGKGEEECGEESHGGQ